MDKQYKDMSVGEGLIEALKQAVEYEKWDGVKGVASGKITITQMIDDNTQAVTSRSK